MRLSNYHISIKLIRFLQQYHEKYLEIETKIEFELTIIN